MSWLTVAILALAFYCALKLHALGKAQYLVAQIRDTQFKHLSKATKKEKPKALAYGWFDEGFPEESSDEDDEEGNRFPTANPSLRDLRDAYTEEMWIAEYSSLCGATERLNFLRGLRRDTNHFSAAFLDLVFGDCNVAIRAWAAGHLELEVTDYSDPQNSKQIRDYQTMLRDDPEPVVRAALWSNPEHKRLPWNMIWVSDTWIEDFCKMSQLERLGLMRNPQLSDRYIVKLMEASSEELSISTADHVALLKAAALNPSFIQGSRSTGRDHWMVMGDVSSPTEEYGTFWDLSLDKWSEHKSVAYWFFKYVQTTPAKKLAAYHKLVGNEKDSDDGWLREEIIRSCDPMKEAQLLKVAWEDKDEKCRQAAKERIGPYGKIMGIDKG